MIDRTVFFQFECYLILLMKMLFVVGVDDKLMKAVFYVSILTTLVMTGVAIGLVKTYGEHLALNFFCVNQ